MEKLVIIDGSYEQRGSIRGDLLAWAWELTKQVSICDVDEYYIEDGINACVGCQPKRPECKFDDQFSEIRWATQSASMVMIGTHDYLGMPTPKIMSLLGRFRCCPEVIRGKKAYVYANGNYATVGYAARVLTEACQFAGFIIQDRLIKIVDR